jgi:YD repeat-containing protein
MNFPLRTRESESGGVRAATVSSRRRTERLGEAADVIFAYNTTGYVTSETTTVNAGGSTTIDNKAFNTDGRLASEIISTTSADGSTVTLKYDDIGDGVIDRQQTDTTVTNADGSVTQTVANYNGAGTLLTGEQVTTTSADGSTVTISRDSTGSGHFDQVETRLSPRTAPRL